MNDAMNIPIGTITISLTGKGSIDPDSGQAEVDVSVPPSAALKIDLPGINPRKTAAHLLRKFADDLDRG